MLKDIFILPSGRVYTRVVWSRESVVFYDETSGLENERGLS